ADMLAALQSVAFEDICITSTIKLVGLTGPEQAFRLPELPGISVMFDSADGEKCQRCWKILPDVGQHDHPATCRRCNDALG
ncbi:MAG: zinc finger domain-containing protein, partial [Paracoccaceae bacterium]|nr:zinc finger domain-containing protein [Paracoccaceae bacterium]